MSNLSPVVARNLWIGAMVVASTVTTLALACATPFPALAALAALHVRRTEGVALMVVAWIAAQVTGFCVLRYAVDANNVAWALALGAAAIGSFFAADLTAKTMPGAPYVARLIAGYAAAYVGFKAVVLLGAFALDSGWAAFTPEVLLRQFVRYGLILLGLVAFQRLLTLVGIDGAARPAHA